LNLTLLEYDLHVFADLFLLPILLTSGLNVKDGGLYFWIENELHLKEAGVEKEDPISPLVQLAPVLNLKIFQKVETIWLVNIFF
jgi:hypothetical protein